MQQQLSITLDLAVLYQRLDENGKKVMLDVLTEGVSQGFVRDMLIKQWQAEIQPPEPQPE